MRYNIEDKFVSKDAVYRALCGLMMMIRYKNLSGLKIRFIFIYPTYSIDSETFES